jgi:hypothetical protein
MKFDPEFVEKMNELEFARFFKRIRENILKDPLNNFVKNEHLINFQPGPGQSVFFKVIFGQKLDYITKHPVLTETSEGLRSEDFKLEYRNYTEVELYELFSGLVYRYTPEPRNRINNILGRRAGKTITASILSLFQAIRVNWKPFLTKTPVASVVVLSHSVEFSQEVLDVIKGLIDDSPIFTRLRDLQRKNTQSVFHLAVPFLQDDGKTIEYSRVAIKVGAASKRTTRGRAVCTYIADEIAHWGAGDESKETDVDIIRALRPSLLQFGKHAAQFKLSSPWAKVGILYEEWMRREELQEDYIQLKAPSWMMNPILPEQEFAKEFRDDPEGFDTEFRANFSDSVSNFIQSEFVDTCVLKDTIFLPPAEKRQGVRYEAAIDAAFKSDRFAFVLVGNNGHRITQYVSKKWEGSKGDPVKAFEVAKFISNICKDYGVNQVSADQYAFQPLKEIFQQFNISLVEQTFTITFKKKIFFTLRRAIHNNTLDLLDDRTLIKEIKELQVEQTGMGQIRIGHLRGGHDDIACALAIAVHTVMEKSGTGEMTSAGTTTYSEQPTDMFGRTFTAPNPELLGAYKGFEGVVDNTKDWIRDSQTGKMRRVSEIEQENEGDNDGFNFAI